MTRSVDRLTDAAYDLLVIGGGVYGAFVAWDGALRGLKVALVEQGDFAGATSGNSQGILHGGFRYLQQLDLQRARESARERSSWLRIAPHFVRPLPCLVTMERGREVPAPLVAAGTMIYRLIARDGMPARGGPSLPPPRRVSASECASLAPGLATSGPGILFHDGYARDADRLVLAVLRSADRAGAAVANYVRVLGPLRGASGARAVDLLSGRSMEIRARAIANCGGPWVEGVRGMLGGPRRSARLVRAFLLATNHVLSGIAVGVPAARPGVRADGNAGRDRYLFLTPTRAGSLMGTWYARHAGDAAELRVSLEDIAAVIAEVNRSYPPASLRQGDVRRVHAGLLPGSDRPEDGSGVSCSRTPRIHVDCDPGAGLVISIVGVKFTTARLLAERAVDEVSQRLRARVSPCRTHNTVVNDGETLQPGDVASMVRVASEHPIEEGMARSLIDRYGRASGGILREAAENSRLAEPVSPGSGVIGAQIVHAARSEMAQKLADVVFRRTGLAESGQAADPAALRACASLLGAELGWTESRVRNEIGEVESVAAPRPPA